MKYTLSALWLALLLTLSQLGMAQNPPAGFTSTVVSTGWNEAVGLTFTSSGSQMFVWERPGKVWVVTNGQRQLVLDISEEVGAWDDHGLIGFALDPQFDANGYMYLLYVVDRHYLLNFGTPAYNPATNDYNSATIGRLTRYTATPSGNGYTVNLASRKILLGATKTTGIPSTAGGHVTGALAFGADGTLLVSTGDGAHWAPDLGSSSETSYAQALADGIITSKENVGALRSQLVNNLNGKILRIDPATGAGIPSNPFYDASNPNAPRSKVWALGFRNPFRMTVKPGTGSPDPAAANPGTLYIGNVGGSFWEEIELVDRPRQNLGWPLFEGLTPNDAFAASNVYNQDAPNPQYGLGGCTQQYFYFRDLLKQETPTGTATFPNPCDNTKAIPSSVPTFVHRRPLIDWGHGTGPSRTGIFSGSTAATINIGAAGSPVAGPQFGGNSSSGGVFYPYTDWPAAYQNTYFFGDYVGGWIRSMTVDASNKPSQVRDFVNSGAVPVAMAVSPGETGLFYVNFYPSEIRKLSYVTSATPPKAVASANKTYGPGPLAVQFTGSASSDPGGSPLTYQWNFGDGGTSTATNPAHTFAPPTTNVTNYTVTLTVRNSAGLTNQTTLVISVNNTPPQVTITSPAVGTRYPMTGNTTYNLRATVTDPEHSAAQLSYQWQTILHHGTHQHPDPVDTNVETSTTIEPYGCGSETYYYVVQLTVTDAAGLATTQQVRLDPDCTTTTFTLVDADSNEDIQAVVNGAVLNLATLPTRNLNIRANVNAATTGSVVFALSGTQTQNQTDSGFPYALFGDVSGIYNAWTPPVGNYTLMATPYSGANGSGTAAPVLMANFSVTDQLPAGSYTLTATAGSNGSVSKSPDQASYASGTVVTLTATPAAGYQFAGWSGDASGTTNPLSVTMTGNKTITATFTAIPPTTYVLTTATVGSGTVTKNPNAASYASGTVVSLTATPAAGYTFSGWSGDATGTTNPLSVTMSANKSITATFTAIPAGQSVTSYTLVNADTDTDIQPLTAGATLNLATLPTRNLNVRANTNPATVGSVVFALSGAQTRSQTEGVAPYALFSDANADYNPWTPAVGSYSLTARPYSAASGGGTAGTALTISFSVTDATAPGPFTLTTSVVGSGSVTKNPNAASYASGTVVSLTATPAAGQQFSGWSGDASGTTNPLSVTMSANKSITATFTAIPAGQSVTSYTLVNADTDTDIQPLTAGATLNLATLPTRNLNVRANTNPATVGSVVFALSGTQTRSQTEGVPPYALFSDANADYNPWTPAVGSYSLTARPYSAASGGGTAGTALTISFSVTDATAPGPFTLTTSTVGSGSVTKNPNAASYASGTVVSLTATPAAGYTFSGWSGDATGTTNPLAVTMTGNRSITATFTANPGGTTFYRAVNINGGAIVLDGQNWVGSSGAANFQVTGPTFANQAIALNPATDATRAGMIRSSVFGPSITATMSSVPAGTYSVYLYVWEDNNAEIYTIRLEGQIVQANYNSGTAGHWDRLGPYTAAITDGAINIALSGGWANFSGMEVWQQNPAAKATTSTSVATATGLTTPKPGSAVASPPARVYPNPSGTGRYQVLLPEPAAGDLTYTLLSATGARLAQGQRRGGSQLLHFNFEQEITAPGLYYLLLEGPGALHARLKLMRE
ncbi:PKD domain-containing protein [Hymenobacter aquaticus]|uniref:PKD domain-containing protein n=1 Tax=Hymenobacter aquaticus TaxID=1867101 RepID=A0A4Z0Q5X1_9BACT|nr:PQQ-dependent sugar dehydrogenase [Hymenobacter aquaticus]TGE24819.1 PKD domain-containing protein [Hymenobacter aquaticus]